MPWLSDVLSNPAAKEWVVTFAAVASAIAALASWRAASKANQASQKLVDIESERWHADRAPQFDLAITPGVGTSGQLIMTLTGPSFIQGVDSLTVEIRDGPVPVEPLWGVGRQPTPEEAATEVIHAAFQFFELAPNDKPMCGSWMLLGRKVSLPALALHNSARFMLAPTKAPAWWTENSRSWWQKSYWRDPLRLTLICTSEGHERWEIVRTVDVKWREGLLPNGMPIDRARPGAI